MAPIPSDHSGGNVIQDLLIVFIGSLISGLVVSTYAVRKLKDELTQARPDPGSLTPEVAANITHSLPASQRYPYLPPPPPAYSPPAGIPEGASQEMTESSV